MASMSQLADDIFTCTLCVEKFREPRTLPCLHTFCRSCLGLYIRQTMVKGTFMCPLCGQETKSEISGLSVDQWMETFVANHFIVSLLKISETRESEKSCGICKQEHVLVEAISWCKECLEALCEECERVHGRIKASRDHHTVSIEYLENGGLEKLLRLKRGPLDCADHKGNPLSMVCLNCKKFVCETCTAVTHVGCKQIQTADKVAIDLKKDILVAKDNIISHRQAAQNLSKISQEHLEGLTKSRDAVLADISRHVEVMMGLVLEKQNKLIAEVEFMYEKQRDHISERVLNGDVRINSLHKAERFLDQLLMYGSEVDVLNNFENIAKQIQILNKQVPVVNQTRDSMQMKYIQDRKSVESLRSVPSLGEVRVIKASKQSVKMKPEATLTLPPPQIPTAPSQGLTSHRKTPGSTRGTPRTRVVSSFSGRSRSDTMRTDIRGVLLLRSGDVVVMDVHFRNKRLKKFTPRGKLVSEADLGECPHSIALVSQTEAVVTLPKSREFAFFTIGGTLHLTGKIKTQKSYFSLASSSEQVLATVGLSAPDVLSIDVISCNGEILNTISLDRAKFHRIPLDLTLSPSGDLLLLCPGRDVLTCINMSGDVLYTYQPSKAQEVKGPICVTTDTQGRTLLVDKASSKIHVISGDGIHQGELLSRRDGLREPQVAVVGDSGITVVAQTNGEIKLFTIAKIL
ncbi:E3 ubiquitin-protein ligase TRIM56-like [Haliotis cracherodii]|uniref:E3 ubiquitin-protein ligase TRIM56-like n=1 Tax=Haliotis cracherodii TaxID=6455 RepID=UPI0039E79D00